MADERQAIEVFQSDAPVHDWTIRVGERYNDHLTFGEMLEILVFLTRDGSVGDPLKAPYGGLKTAAEFAQERCRWEHRHDQEPAQGNTIDAEFQAGEAQSQ